MDPDRWAQVRGLFDSALEQEPGSRTVFLEQACAGDRALLEEVRNMLASFEDSPQFMDSPVAPAAALRRELDDRDSMEGQCIGPYKILRRVGSGGMGSVYAAARVDQQFHKLVALKVVKRGMDSEEILRRFRNERQVLAGLEHPNIARLLDGGTTEQGLPYLVMEYVEGTPIDQYCDSHKFTITERLELFRTVCGAVQYAHQNLVVHRDLKPGNIMVTAQGVPKLLDFGIAKLLRPDFAGQSVHLTRSSLRPMTPEYASPEQVRGDPITTASDVYALGVLLYKLLTGHQPYRLKTHTSMEIEQAVVEWEPERPSVAAMRVENRQSGEGESTAITPEAVSESREGRPDKLRRRLRGDLDMIVLTALRKEPQRRYASVERFYEDITRHLNGLPVTARKDTVGYRAGKFVGRNKAGVAVAVLVALALITSTIVSIYWAQAAAAQKEMALRLLTFMIGDFDAAMQSGVTSARKVSADKALEAIQQLAPDAANDRSLRKLLIQAYLNVGDLQDNLYGPNLGDAAGAKQSYEKALELAQTALRSNPGNKAYQSDVALAERRLGDLAASSGDWKTALEQYRRTRDFLEKALTANPQQQQTLRDLKQLWWKIGIAHDALGNAPQTLQSYQRELKLAGQLSAARPGDPEARRDVAMAEEHTGGALAKTGNTAEGLQHLGTALGIYQSLLRINPSSFPLKRDTGLIYVVRADVLSAAGRLADAEQDFRTGLRTLDSLAQEDPHNEQYQRDTNSALCRLAETLLKEGKVAEARPVTERALASLEPLANKAQPSAYDIQQYCWILLNTPFRELHNPPVALEFAQKAVDLTRRGNPEALDLLACAYEENADFTKAVETERQALALLPRPQPGNAVSSYRAVFENNLKKFEGELTRARAPAGRNP